MPPNDDTDDASLSLYDKLQLSAQRKEDLYQQAFKSTNHFKLNDTELSYYNKLLEREKVSTRGDKLNSLRDAERFNRMKKTDEVIVGNRVITKKNVDKGGVLDKGGDKGGGDRLDEVDEIRLAKKRRMDGMVEKQGDEKQGDEKGEYLGDEKKGEYLGDEKQGEYLGDEKQGEYLGDEKHGEYLGNLKKQAENVIEGNVNSENMVHNGKGEYLGDEKQGEYLGDEKQGENYGDEKQGENVIEGNVNSENMVHNEKGELLVKSNDKSNGNDNDNNTSSVLNSGLIGDYSSDED